MSTPILLLHGFPLDARMWDEQVAALDQAGIEALAPNLPGREPDDDLSSWAGKVLQLFPGDFIPVGCSMGGYLVFELFRQAPARMPAAVFVDTRAGADTPEARQGREDTIRLLEDKGFDPFWEGQAQTLFSANADPKVVSRAREIAAGQPVPNLVATLRALATRPDSAETAASMEVPAVVVVGEEDVLTPPADAAELAALLPQGNLVQIPRAGHMTPLEAPTQLNEEILVFLAGLDSAAQS